MFYSSYFVKTKNDAFFISQWLKTCRLLQNVFFKYQAQIIASVTQDLGYNLSRYLSYLKPYDHPLIIFKLTLNILPPLLI